MHASYEVGKHRADAYYNAEPDVMNCPIGHTCAWEEHDTTDGMCLKNCSVSNAVMPAVIWEGDRPTCPDGFTAVADEHEALAGRDSVHCVK